MESERRDCTELNGSTALIIGPGAIGGEIGRILQAFEVHTIGCNRSGEEAPYMNETHKLDEIKTTFIKSRYCHFNAPIDKGNKIFTNKRTF